LPLDALAAIGLVALMVLVVIALPAPVEDTALVPIRLPVMVAALPLPALLLTDRVTVALSGPVVALPGAVDVTVLRTRPLELAMAIPRLYPVIARIAARVEAAKALACAVDVKERVTWLLSDTVEAWPVAVLEPGSIVVPPPPASWAGKTDERFGNICGGRL
jgi:hypothetical protein